MPYVKSEYDARPHEEVAYEVQGDADKSYTVVKEKSNGRWYCGCEKFRFTPRLARQFKAEIYPFDREPCKHIREALRYYNTHRTKDFKIMLLTEVNGKWEVLQSINKKATEDDMQVFWTNLKGKK